MLGLRRRAHYQMRHKVGSADTSLNGSDRGLDMVRGSGLLPKPETVSAAISHPWSWSSWNGDSGTCMHSKSPRTLRLVHQGTGIIAVY